MPSSTWRLPSGVRLMDEGRVRFFTQRVTAPPMADCMFAALCTPLSFIGLDVPETFVGDLREASGVPVYRKKKGEKKGEPQGTTTAASKKAIAVLFGDLPGLTFEAMDDEDMLERLRAGQIAVRVIVSNQKLPPRLRRWVGKKWDGLHAIALGGARRIDGGEWQVFWMDPAGRPARGYEGEFVPYRDVRQALRRNSQGKVKVTVGRRDAAISSPVTSVEPIPAPTTTDVNEEQQPGGPAVRVLTRATPGERARIARGTAFFHPETLRRVTSARKEGDFRLAGRSPDGEWVGVWVSTRQIAGATGLTLLLAKADSIGKPFVVDEP